MSQGGGSDAIFEFEMGSSENTKSADSRKKYVASPKPHVNGSSSLSINSSEIQSQKKSTDFGSEMDAEQLNATSLMALDEKKEKEEEKIQVGIQRRFSVGQSSDNLHVRVGPPVEDDSVAQTDPSRRFLRYCDIVGQGRFKTVYQGYDTETGIDVAWSQIDGIQKDISLEQLDQICKEMQKGIQLDHPNIIKCYKCWVDEDKKCLNLITEFFTSGTLREYRQQYKRLDPRVHRKYARQFLNGLQYLHNLKPPVVHGDLRLNKIYINGFNGEVKIGDLGLSALLEKRYSSSQKTYTKSLSADIYAFGLCVLELITGWKKSGKDTNISQLEFWKVLRMVKEESARRFISQCLGPPISRPNPTQLLESDYMKMPVVVVSKNGCVDWNGSERKEEEPIIIRGEDWDFEFSGRMSKTNGNCLHIKLVMLKDNDTDPSQSKKTLNFEYNLETDTPDSVGNDIADSFALSTTDRQICEAGLREWLAITLSPKDDCCLIDD